jgi:hypothetical protein
LIRQKRSVRHQVPTYLPSRHSFGPTHLLLQHTQKNPPSLPWPTLLLPATPKLFPTFLEVRHHPAPQPTPPNIAPKEIRNHIYAAAIAGEDFSVTLRGSHREDERRVKTWRRRPNWCVNRRPLLGLTQTCRQLRAEFLPLYYQSLHVTIPYMHVNSYMDTFIYQSKTDQPHRITHCNVSVSHHSGYRHVLRGKNRHRIDVAPLLRTCDENPGFKRGVGQSHFLQYVLGTFRHTCQASVRGIGE